jgi:hypothetical protein
MLIVITLGYLVAFIWRLGRIGNVLYNLLRKIRIKVKRNVLRVFLCRSFFQRTA